MFYGTVAHLHPATFFAVLGGIIECSEAPRSAWASSAGSRPPGSLGDMIMAMATVTFGNGIVSNAPGAGYELNLALAALAFVVALLGTGRFSLDVAAANACWKSRASETELGERRPGHADRTDQHRGHRARRERASRGSGGPAVPRPTVPTGCRRSPRRRGGWAGWPSPPSPPFRWSKPSASWRRHSHLVLYGDQALLELGARRAVHFDQLVGPYSRAGFHQPGPAVFYLLAPFVRILEPAGPGLYLGAIAINGAALIATVAFLWRRFGPLAALWAAAAIDLYCLCVGVGTLREPWNPYLVVAPMVLFVVLWAAGITGTSGAAVWAMVVGSYEVQTHIATAVFVVAMSAILAGVARSGPDGAPPRDGPARTVGPGAGHRLPSPWC